jgi:hypothetical protein
MALTTDKWIGGASADWGASAVNWSAGLPNSNDNVVISTAAVLTVSYSGSDTYVVNSLAVGQDFFDISGGSLTITTTASFADGLIQTGGVLTAGGKVTVDGTGTLTGGSAEGRTDFIFDGTVALGNYTLGGATVLNNKKTTNLTSGITLGDNTGLNATIDNEKGGVFDIGGDFSIAEGAATAKFDNAGTFEKTGGTGTTMIDVDFTDTGKIIVATAGTIEFAGPENSFAGTISGAGTFEIGVFDAPDDATIGKGTAISTAAFTITGNQTTVMLAENLSYAGAFTLQGGPVTLDLASGVTFTLSGTDAFTVSAALDGNGVLVTAKGSSTDLSSFTFGGSDVWQNFGTVGQAGGIAIGDSSFNAATFINEKGGLYEFSGGYNIAVGAALDSSFVNDLGATFEDIVGAANTVGVDFFNSGAIVVGKAGTIDFTGAENGFAGTISGAGTFEIGGGSNLIGPGARITAAAFTISGDSVGAEVALGAALDYGGTFSLEQMLFVDLDGFSLTLSGTNSFSGNLPLFAPTIDGGRGSLLVTAKGSTTTVDGVILGGAVDWQNSGLVDGTGTLVIGDGTFNTATFTNERGGVYDFLGDAGIAGGSVPNSRFINSAGATFEKTAGTGDSAVAVAFTNDGTVAVETGTVEFQSAVAGSGKFSIAANAILQFDTSVAAGPSIDFATTKGGELLLVDSRQFGAAIHGFGGADALDLRDINFTSGDFRLSYSGNSKQGVLTVTDGTDTAHLTLFGDYKTADFHASADGSGGTLIVDPAAHEALLASSR